GAREGDFARNKQRRRRRRCRQRSLITVRQESRAVEGKERPRCSNGSASSAPPAPEPCRR
ncbi:unnamed protein product, partial [Ixodes hexagonus]